MLFTSMVTYVSITSFSRAKHVFLSRYTMAAILRTRLASKLEVNKLLANLKGKTNIEAYTSFSIFSFNDLHRQTLSCVCLDTVWQTPN